MPGKTVFLFLFFTGVLFCPGLMAADSILVHADSGTYNQRYYDRNYVDHNETTFGMQQASFGIEYVHTDSGGVSCGGGYAFTNIDDGRKWNRDRYEVHPLTIVMVPYLFSGYSFDSFGIELGISCYIQMSRQDARLYYMPDGSVFEEEDGGIQFDRENSHVFINARIRLFSENSLHCKVRIGRENFDPVDSLICFAVVYPADRHRFEYYLSFLTIDNYFYTIFNQDNILKANQTTGILYSYDFGIISLGVRGGILIYNAHGGDGKLQFLNRLNCGFFSMLKW